jgi:hypothetical protein
MKITNINIMPFGLHIYTYTYTQWCLIYIHIHSMVFDIHTHTFNGVLNYGFDTLFENMFRAFLNSFVFITQ